MHGGNRCWSVTHVKSVTTACNLPRCNCFWWLSEHGMLQGCLQCVLRPMHSWTGSVKPVCLSYRGLYLWAGHCRKTQVSITEVGVFQVWSGVLPAFISSFFSFTRGLDQGLDYRLEYSCLLLLERVIFLIHPLSLV